MVPLSFPLPAGVHWLRQLPLWHLKVVRLVHAPAPGKHESEANGQLRSNFSLAVHEPQTKLAHLFGAFLTQTTTYLNVLPASPAVCQTTGAC